MRRFLWNVLRRNWNLRLSVWWNVNLFSHSNVCDIIRAHSAFVNAIVNSDLSRFSLLHAEINEDDETDERHKDKAERRTKKSILLLPIIGKYFLPSFGTAVYLTKNELPAVFLLAPWQWLSLLSRLRWSNITFEKEKRNKFQWILISSSTTTLITTFRCRIIPWKSEEDRKKYKKNAKLNRSNNMNIPHRLKDNHLTILHIFGALAILFLCSCFACLVRAFVGFVVVMVILCVRVVYVVKW